MSIMRRAETGRQTTARPVRKSRTAAPVIDALACALLIAAVVGAGCSEQITKHGQLFREADLQQVQPGMGQEQVTAALGTPTTTTTAGTGQAWYYISSTETQSAFFTPKEVDRQVLAVYFTPTQTVERVANYGLKDGKVFDFVSRTTPAPGGRDEGLLKSLFRNLGQKQIFGE